MKRISQFILCIIVFLILISLCGCAKTDTVSETIANNAINATTALEQSLPAECKTESINTQFTVIKTEIRAIKSACEQEKEIITQEKLKWKYSFIGLVIIIGVYIARKILK